jgi:amidase
MDVTSATPEPRGTVGNELCFMGVRELARKIHARSVSAREVMAEFLKQIDRLNPTLNAIVAKLNDDVCLALADAADREIDRDDKPNGLLLGLPIAFKDLEPAVGFPQTKGSPIFRDFMPAADSILVERLKRAGALPIGKTNVPEFGMGSQTYNTVYGTTLNPFDTTRTAGGSSGGAAVAVATGMLPFADGSDLGGSLRNPANFNNLVALRPSIGLVPSWPSPNPLVNMSVKGMLARTVDDLAFGLSIVAGFDERDPQSFESPRFFSSVQSELPSGIHVAWCPDLGGLPLDPRVRTVLERQRRTFETLGFIVEEACPDFGNVDEIFLTLRQWASWNTYKELLHHRRAELKPEAISEIEAGARLSGEDVARALMAQAQLLERLRHFQEKYRFIVCAVNQVAPFAATEHWPQSINGVAMENYIAWMKSTYWISATCRPAISVPAGFTDDGLPVGIQIVGRYRRDYQVLQLAHAFEEATGFGRRRPPEA